MQRINLIFGIVMGIIYLIAGGFIFASSPVLLSDLDPLYRKILGLLIILYGTFRFFKVYKKYNEYKNEGSDAD